MCVATSFTLQNLLTEREKKSKRESQFLSTSFHCIFPVHLFKACGSWWRYRKKRILMCLKIKLNPWLRVTKVRPRQCWPPPPPTVCDRETHFPLFVPPHWLVIASDTFSAIRAPALIGDCVRQHQQTNKQTNKQTAQWCNIQCCNQNIRTSTATCFDRLWVIVREYTSVTYVQNVDMCKQIRLKLVIYVFRWLEGCDLEKIYGLYRYNWFALPEHDPKRVETNWSWRFNVLIVKSCVIILCLLFVFPYVLTVSQFGLRHISLESSNWTHSKIFPQWNFVSVSDVPQYSSLSTFCVLTF
jgi:hypothetical protein